MRGEERRVGPGNVSWIWIEVGESAAACLFHNWLGRSIFCWRRRGSC